MYVQLRTRKRDETRMVNRNEARRNGEKKDREQICLLRRYKTEMEVRNKIVPFAKPDIMHIVVVLVAKRSAKEIHPMEGNSRSRLFHSVALNIMYLKGVEKC